MPLLVVLMLLGSVCLATAQGPRTGLLQDAATTGNGTDLNTVGYSVVSVVVSGVAAGANRVVTFNVSVDGTLFENVLCRNVKDGSQATTQTASGTTVYQWTCPVPGMQKFRAVVSGGTTGAVNVTATALPQVSAVPLLPTSGTGSGTVTSVATTSPLTGGPITTTGTLACATCAVTTGTLGQFAATTSAQLAGVLSDKTGTGAAVFAVAPTFGASVNGFSTVTLANPNTGASAAVNLTLSSDSADLYIGTTGANYAGALGADLAFIFTDTTASNGLLISARAGGLKFYTNGSETNLRMTIANDGSMTLATLATTGAATGKTMVCADTAGTLYRSSSATNCLN